MKKSFQAIFLQRCEKYPFLKKVRLYDVYVVDIVNIFILFSINGFDTNGCE